MEVTKFGVQWSLPILLIHPDNPRKYLEEVGTSPFDTQYPYPFLFYLKTYWGRIKGKQHFPLHWRGGCGVTTLEMALSVSWLWEISEHINRAYVETSAQQQLAHIKGAIIKLYKLCKSPQGEILRQSGLEMLQPYWLDFYSALYDSMWARCLSISEDGNKNIDVCIIAGLAFKKLSDLSQKTGDRDAVTSAKETFELALLGITFNNRRLPFEKSSEEVKAGAHACRFGKLLILSVKPSPFIKKCKELFDRLSRSGWESSAEYSTQELKSQANDWISSNFDNAIVSLPSQELQQ